MNTFDPSEYIRGIQQLLISDKKKIGFLCGAGTSLAKKDERTKVVPAVNNMTKSISTKLRKTQKFVSALDEIEAEIVVKYGDGRFNVETLLTNIEEKKEVIGQGSLNGLSQNEFLELSKEIKRNIHAIVSIHKKILVEDYEYMVHNDFARWIVNADRQYPVEIFTTNYDYLFELGLENNQVPYYDGFVGSFNPFFNADSVDGFEYLPKQTKLWKIHGSLGWKIAEDKKVIRTRTDEDDILIYPSITKYENSKKMPYTALMDRLSNFLKQQDTVLFVCGYSFNDEHINERILSGLRNNSTSHIFVLLYDIEWNENTKLYALSENSKLAKLALKNNRISIFGCRNAIIGGKYGEWMLKREPDKDETLSTNYYFDEDAPIDESLPLNIKKTGEQGWTGKGELILPDFAKFVRFLQSINYNSKVNDKHE